MVFAIIIVVIEIVVLFSCLIFYFLKNKFYFKKHLQTVFSSPEHKVLRVSYCDQPLSVVVRRALCVNFFT